MPNGQIEQNWSAFAAGAMTNSGIEAFAPLAHILTERSPRSANQAEDEARLMRG
jgi:hypothetical protein